MKDILQVAEAKRVFRGARELSSWLNFRYTLKPLALFVYLGCFAGITRATRREIVTPNALVQSREDFKMMRSFRFLAMKGFFLVTLLVWFLATPVHIRGEDRIQLRLPNPEFKPGQVLDITTRLFQENRRTNDFEGELSETNVISFFELKGRIKILEWNETERTSKTDVTLDYFLQGTATATNSLIGPGRHLSCNYFAGESFFKMSEGYLSIDANQVLRTLLQMTPGGKRDSADSELMKLDIPRAVGETWEASPENVIGLIVPLYGPVETNHVESSVTFLSLTNISGVNCFQVQFQASALTERPPRVPVLARGLGDKSRARIQIWGTNVCPISAMLPRLWASKYTIDGSGEMKAGEPKGVVRVRYLQAQSVQLSPVSGFNNN